MSKTQDFKFFLENIGNLEPVELVGMARLLRVIITKQDTSESVLEKLMDGFLALGRKDRRTFIRILRAAVGDKYGTKTTIED